MMEYIQYVFYGPYKLTSDFIRISSESVFYT